MSTGTAKGAWVRRIIIICSYTALLCALWPAAQAEVYKWTDAEGRVHFGDQPPHTDAEAVTIRGAGSPDAAAPEPAATAQERAEKQRRLLDAYAEERRLRKEAEEKAQQDKQQRQRNCATARDTLNNYLSAGGIYDLDKDGNRVYLDAAAREDTIERARREVEHWCGK